MIPNGKIVKISNSTLITIPSSWREEINLVPGSLMKMYIRKNSVIIMENNQYTTENHK